MESKEKITSRYTGKHVVITFEEPLKKGDRKEVSITYRVEKVVSGLIYGGPEKNYPEEPRYLVADCETERAQYWLPCIDLPSVRTTVEWHVTHEKSVVCVCNGERKGVSEREGKVTTFYSLDFPCPSYLLCFGVGEYIKYEEPKGETIPVTYYGLKGTNPEDLKRSFGETPKMIEWLEKKLGNKLPWKKYDQIIAPTHGGAMENISLVTWSPRFVVNERFAMDWKFDYPLFLFFCLS